MPVGTRISKRTKMSECSFDALPCEIQLRILREGLITVEDDTHPEPLEGKYRPSGPPPAFQVSDILVALEGAICFGDQVKVPKGIVDGLHDVKIAAQVACLSEYMSELTRTGLFEERLAALEAVFDSGCDVELEGTCAQNSELKQYIDPRHIDGWSTRSTAEKYRALLNHLNCCCLRVWNMLDSDPNLNKARVDKARRYVIFEAFASMIISNGSTFIDIWELLIGGYDNMSALSDTVNRERIYEAQETVNDLLMQQVGMGMG